MDKVILEVKMSEWDGVLKANPKAYVRGYDQKMRGIKEIGMDAADNKFLIDYPDPFPNHKTDDDWQFFLGQNAALEECERLRFNRDLGYLLSRRKKASG